MSQTRHELNDITSRILQMARMIFQGARMISCCLYDFTFLTYYFTLQVQIYIARMILQLSFIILHYRCKFTLRVWFFIWRVWFYCARMISHLARMMLLCAYDFTCGTYLPLKSFFQVRATFKKFVWTDCTLEHISWYYRYDFTTGGYDFTLHVWFYNCHLLFYMTGTNLHCAYDFSLGTYDCTLRVWFPFDV